MRSQAPSCCLGTVYNLEVRLALVTDRVSWTAYINLSWIRPSLIYRAIPWEASLAGTIAVVWIGSHSYVRVAALHKTQVVSGASLASIFAITKLEKCLRLPLTIQAPLSMAAESQTYSVEWSDDCMLMVWLNGRRLGMLDHLEVGRDSVDGDLFLKRALVVDMEIEAPVLMVPVMSVRIPSSDNWIFDDCEVRRFNR